MLTYTEAKEVQNRTSPEKDPWLSLGCMIGKRHLDMTFGSKKAYYFLHNLDNMVKAKEEFTGENFVYTLVIDEGKQYQSTVEITEPKLELLLHYRQEMIEYLAKYPYVPYKRTAIEAPFVKTELSGLEYVKVLYLPCWEKTENDEGEGLIPKKITQKTADFLMKKAFGGQAFAKFQEGIANGMEEIVDEYKAQSGEVYKSKYDLATMKCLVKYKLQLMEFALSGQLSA